MYTTKGAEHAHRSTVLLSSAHWKRYRGALDRTGVVGLCDASEARGIWGATQELGDGAYDTAVAGRVHRKDAGHKYLRRLKNGPLTYKMCPNSRFFLPPVRHTWLCSARSFHCVNNRIEAWFLVKELEKAVCLFPFNYDINIYVRYTFTRCITMTWGIICIWKLICWSQYMRCTGETRPVPSIPFLLRAPLTALWILPDLGGTHYHQFLGPNMASNERAVSYFLCIHTNLTILVDNSVGI